MRHSYSLKHQLFRSGVGGQAGHRNAPGPQVPRSDTTYDAEDDLFEPDPSYPSSSIREFNNTTVSDRELDDLSTQAIVAPAVALPISIDQRQEALAQARQPWVDYAAMLKSCLTDVVASAWDEEIVQQHSVAQSLGRNTYRILGVQILASIPTAILQLIINGNLCRAVEEKTHNTSEYYASSSAWVANASNKYSPGIYIRQLVDKYGQAPTPNEFLLVINRLRTYISGTQSSLQDALALDNVRGARSTLECLKKGQHYYLQGLLSRVQKVLTFCKAFEQCVAEMEPDQPMAAPLKYVGYSMCTTVRGEQHDQGGTSWFHHLVGDAFRIQFGNRFSFVGHTVCFMVSAKEVAVAESLIGTITNSSIECGGGFGVFQGGIQIHSAKLSGKTSEEQAQIWDACKAWRERSTPYTENIKAEKQRLRSAADHPSSNSPGALMRNIKDLDRGILEVRNAPRPTVQEIEAKRERDRKIRSDFMAKVEESKKVVRSELGAKVIQDLVDRIEREPAL